MTAYDRKMNKAPISFLVDELSSQSFFLENPCTGCKCDNECEGIIEYHTILNI